MQLKGKKAKLVVVGKKAIEYFEKKGYDVAYKFPDFAETIDFVQANQLASVVLELFNKGEIDDLTLIYTEFVSALTQNVQVKKLLPLYIEKEDYEYKAVVYDPSPTAVFDSIIPIYLEGVLYAAVLEAFASEQGARRTAMEAANDNAKEMIEQLNLLYNRARQANITQELSEIVSGAEALK